MGDKYEIVNERCPFSLKTIKEMDENDLIVLKINGKFRGYDIRMLWENVFTHYKFEEPETRMMIDIMDMDYMRFEMSKRKILRYNRRSPYNMEAMGVPDEKSNIENSMSVLARVCEDMYIRRVKISEIVEFSGRLRDINFISIFEVRLPLPVNAVQFKLSKSVIEHMGGLDLINMMERHSFVDNDNIIGIYQMADIAELLDTERVCKRRGGGVVDLIMYITDIMILMKMERMRDNENIRIMKKELKGLSGEIERFWRKYYRVCKIGYKGVFCMKYGSI